MRDKPNTMSETQRAFDVEPEAELTHLLRAEGASDAFITLIKTNPEEAGVEVNKARNEVNKWIRWNDGEVEEEALKPHYGGGFFKKMWDGEVYEAYNHADSSNKALLREAFGLSYINRQRPAGYPEVTA